MSERIFWTHREKTLLARKAVELIKEGKHCKIHSAVEEAQTIVLPIHRHRVIKGMHHCKTLLPYIDSEMTSIKSGTAKVEDGSKLLDHTANLDKYLTDIILDSLKPTIRLIVERLKNDLKHSVNELEDHLNKTTKFGKSELSEVTYAPQKKNVVVLGFIDKTGKGVDSTKYKKLNIYYYDKVEDLVEKEFDKPAVLIQNIKTVNSLPSEVVNKFSDLIVSDGDYRNLEKSLQFLNRTLAEYH